MAPTILAADDDADGLFVLEQLLTGAGYSVVTASSGRDVLEKLKQQAPDLALLDVQMPGLSGFDLVEAIKGDETLQFTPVVLLTALADNDSILKGLAKGADDYITKPYSQDQLLARVAAGLRIRALYQKLKGVTERVAALQQRSEQPYRAGQRIIGNHPSLNSVREIILKARDADVPVLITGESGTGKELVAASLHFESKRADKPFVAQNCAALSESLLESELFGHVRGAFTGALRDRPGLFEIADGGTLFLDEIGEMKPALQAKLLRVLQDGLVTPVGGSKPKKCTVRVVAATNRNLEALVKEGSEQFRADLFYRLSVMRIALPALRERLSDVPMLVEHFLNGIAQRTGQAKKHIEPQAVEALSRYSWPGNIRELQNEIERLVIMAGDEVSIPFDLLDERLRLGASASGSTTVGGGLPKAVAELEKEMLKATLKQVQGNKSEAARQLNISRSSLIQKVQFYGIES